jgi:hypothetical protein
VTRSCTMPKPLRKPKEDGVVILPSFQPKVHLGWKDASVLEIPEEMSAEWDSYIKLLCKNFISLNE